MLFAFILISVFVHITFLHSNGGNTRRHRCLMKACLPQPWLAAIHYFFFQLYDPMNSERRRLELFAIVFFPIFHNFSLSQGHQSLRGEHYTRVAPQNTIKFQQLYILQPSPPLSTYQLSAHVSYTLWDSVIYCCAGSSYRILYSKASLSTDLLPCFATPIVMCYAISTMKPVRVPTQHTKEALLETPLTHWIIIVFLILPVYWQPPKSWFAQLPSPAQ